ncbi:MAG: transporter substrate-binding protein [Paenibacillus sp.]|jgi:raffinose/stachyose/melibiose transport system substrate-binding protein|nr:transporter substrate-binding protein [Paenibacillus sp.]
MNKRTLGGLLALSIAVTPALAACSQEQKPAKNAGAAGAAGAAGSANTEQKKQVSFTLAYAAGDPAHKQGIVDIIAAFNKANPNIKVVDVSNNSSATYLEYLKTKDAVGEFPDLVEMRDTQLYADAGKLAELPADVKELFKSTAQVNGKVYTAPIAGSAPQGIIYNKKMYREAGITQEPKTYAEFLELCEKLKAKGIAPLVVGGKDVWHMGFLLNKFLIDDVFIKDPNWNSKRNKGEVSFTDAGPTKAMKDFTRLFEKGYVEKGFLSTADNQTTSMLVTNKAAMLYSGPWMFKQILDADPSFELGFYALPGTDGKINLATLPNQQGWSMTAEAVKNADKAAAMKEFIKFFFTKDQYSKYLELVSAIPTTKENISYKSIEPMQTALKIVSDPNTGHSMQINGFWGENTMPPSFRNWFYKLSQDWASGKMTVEEAMKKSDEQWNIEVKALKK